MHVGVSLSQPQGSIVLLRGEEETGLVNWAGAGALSSCLWPLTLCPFLSQAPVNHLEIALSASRWLVPCVMAFFLSPPKRYDKKPTVRNHSIIKPP